MNKELFKYINKDLPAAIVVFLVAVPLCLGIALASGAPLYAGILAGMIGGLIVPLISNSQLGVSGPAAGLTAIVLMGIERVGGFEAFLVAIVIGGVIQMILSAFRAGTIAYFFPNAVIKGMLAAIGLILILKQLPHAIGYDVEAEGMDSFIVNDQENTFSVIAHALSHVEWGAFIISAVSLAILLLWENTPLKKLSFLPGALVVVIVGVGINALYASVAPEMVLTSTHLVNIPLLDGIGGFLDSFTFPRWSAITDYNVWVAGVTVGLVASIESLLTVDAVDRIDPYNRRSNLNRELLAQGAANTVAGLLGALPVTAVIVRSTTAIASGGRTKMTAFFHGIFILFSVIFAGAVLNMIPLASLAAILLLVGYKLANPTVIKEIYSKGYTQFIPFVVTIVAILLTDLLVGIMIGLAVGIAFVVRQNIKESLEVDKEDNKYKVYLKKDISFLNKMFLMNELERIPEGSKVTVEMKEGIHMDQDVKEMLKNYQDGDVPKKLNVHFKDTSGQLKNNPESVDPH